MIAGLFWFDPRSSPCDFPTVKKTLILTNIFYLPIAEFEFNLLIEVFVLLRFLGIVLGTGHTHL